MGPRPAALDRRVQGFGRSADAYERGRPGYPPDAVRHLVTELGLGPGSVVADVAAGTGKLTRDVTPSVRWVVAVEPIAAMRAQLRVQVPAATVVGARAEALPFIDSSFDALTVAQAFHWFDARAALAEFARVLRPHGALAVVWNERNEAAAIQADLTAVVAPHRGDTPRYQRDRWREPFQRSAFGPLRSASFPWHVTMTEQQLLDRIGSTSFIAMLDGPTGDAVAEQTRSVFARHANPSGTVTLPYIAQIHTTRLRD